MLHLTILVFRRRRSLAPATQSPRVVFSDGKELSTLLHPPHSFPPAVHIALNSIGALGSRISSPGVTTLCDPAGAANRRTYRRPTPMMSAPKQLRSPPPSPVTPFTQATLVVGIVVHVPTVQNPHSHSQRAMKRTSLHQLICPSSLAGKLISSTDCLPVSQSACTSPSHSR
ncbi:hypothetical protein L1887_28100 [Cichorium endivia]|nr:hypothetical protein L1887_28100 [Cichorium endivia]